MSREMIRNMQRQAGRYGEQVRLLEDAGLEDDRRHVRMAWVGFYRQLGRGYLLVLARDSYWKAYGFDVSSQEKHGL